MKLHSEEQVSVDADQLIQAPSHTGDRRGEFSPLDEEVQLDVKQ